MDNYASSWRKKSSENDRRTIDDALYRDWDQGGSNVNRKKVMDALDAERANNPDYIKLKKAADEAGYGSPEWKKWAAADWDLQGKYVKDYTDATLNDFVESGIMNSKQLSKLSDHGKQYLEGQLDFDSYFVDYRSIMDPITKERDYRLADRD